MNFHSWTTSILRQHSFLRKLARSFFVAGLVIGVMELAQWGPLPGSWQARRAANSQMPASLIMAATPPGGIFSKSPALTADDACHRPYSDSSPWNTPIAPNPRYHSESARMIQALEGEFGSNPDAYTYPVYEASSQTSVARMEVLRLYSDVVEGGTKVSVRRGASVSVTIPEGARPSRGTDSQMIIINSATGDEWGFWQARQSGPGKWQAVNGYHYNMRWSGVPPTGFASRGAKVPYLAGLIRPCEIARGAIEHAIAFAYNSPCTPGNCASQGFPFFVYPATGSDGKGTSPGDFPEGARLQLNPNASPEEIRNWCGEDQTCRIIVKALQQFGMITIDHSGHPKIYAEDNLTANWGGALTARTVSKIPLSAFKVLDWTQESRLTKSASLLPGTPAHSW